MAPRTDNLHASLLADRVYSLRDLIGISPALKPEYRGLFDKCLSIELLIEQYLKCSTPPDSHVQILNNIHETHQQYVDLKSDANTDDELFTMNAKLKSAIKKFSTQLRKDRSKFESTGKARCENCASSFKDKATHTMGNSALDSAVSGHQPDMSSATKEIATVASELNIPQPWRLWKSTPKNMKPRGALLLYCALIQRWQDDPLARFYMQKQALKRELEKATDEDFLQERMVSMSTMNQELFEEMLDFDSCENE